MKKLLFCFGTRPEWLKIKPILKYYIKYELLFTGQHYDLLKDIIFDYKIEIKDKGNRLNNIISSCLDQFPKHNFDGIVVQGDTASAFACALHSFNNKIPIYYIEAGLRTNDLDNPYPEEGYRQMISRISNYNFYPTYHSLKTHINENLKSKNYVVGNTVLDNIVNTYTKYDNKVLVTLHRRENHTIIEEWFNEIDKLAKQYNNIEFILPIHPNPNIQKYKDLLKYVNIIDPLEHNDLIDLLKDCKLVISDSGGIQEEATFLNKKTIVCRKNTERPEGIETGHIYLCEKPDLLNNMFNNLLTNYQISKECPYGDGKTGERIANIIKNI